MNKALLGLLALGLGLAHAQSYAMFTFDPPGSTSTTVTGMNNAGQIVGNYTDDSGSHAFLRSVDGVTYTNIEVPGAVAGSTTADGINNLGQIVGDYEDSTGLRSYIRSVDGKTFAAFDFPQVDPGFVGRPRAINDRGEIIGALPFYRYGITGVLRSADGSTYTPISFPASYQTSPQSIANDGTITGWYTLAGTFTYISGPVAATHAFVRSPSGIYTSFDLPGTDGFTQAHTRNNLGLVAGTFGAGFVLYPDGSSVTLSVLGADQTIPAAINDSGVVAGYSMDANGVSRGFLAVPSSSDSRPAIRSEDGVNSPIAFGGRIAVAPGSWIEIYGRNLASTTRGWRQTDFTGNTAPTSLDGVSVRINGRSAYISYVSPGQINALIPDTLTAGPAQVTVSNGSLAGASSPVTVSAFAAGLLDWPFFDSRWLVALFQDGVTYARVEGIDPSLPSRYAKPGDTITLYAIGLGPVTPNIPAGQIATQQNSLAAQVRIGGQPATVTYAGLAPGTVGLYQINVVVPGEAVGSAASGTPVSISLNGVVVATGNIGPLQ
jgi:uncharacterized protein (TIGR03437 family)